MRKYLASDGFRLAALYAGWLALFVYVLLNAWVSEDAYITFRVIDNFMQGYGLRWNIFERVQAYTHPLWLLAHLPVYALWHNLFYVNIALSVFCTSAALAVVLFTFSTSIAHRFLFFILPFALSKCLMDYSTSGLESPLVFLLFAYFGYVLTRLRGHRYFWLLLSFSVSLSLLNRLDTSLVFAPCMAYFCYQYRTTIRWRQVIIGMLPLVAWFVFSFCYYGFLFPNTKYAKLNTDLGLMLYLAQGWNYTFIFLSQDTLSALAIITAIASSFIPRLQQKTDSELRMIAQMIAIGIALYCAYIVYIGGDYMMGRFWAFPTFVSLWLLSWRMRDGMRADIWFAIGCAVIAAFGVSYFLRDIRLTCAACVPMEGRVLDAVKTFRNNRLFATTWPPKMRSEGEYFFSREGKQMALLDTPPTKTLFYVGMSAYYAGPKGTFIDMLALADPLLARLPAMDNKGFYVGHFRRDIPRGYLEALKTGSFDEMDPNLARYYGKLRIITSDELWSFQRFKTIIAFNAGQYDHYKNAYLANRQKPGR